MWNAILSVVGWAFFYALIVSYVWWSIVEQEFFAREDPENWESPLAPDESAADHRYHMPAWGFPILPEGRSA